MTALRPYQAATVARVRERVRGGQRRVLVVMPTGAGKTLTLATIAQAAVAREGRVLWLAHRVELVDQAAGALAALGLRVGVLSAGSRLDADDGAPVQVATVQTLIARDLVPEARVIVADEAHHYAADSFGALLARYPAAWTLGITATPQRGDGRGLGSAFDAPIIVGARVGELTEAGYLVPARVLAPPAPQASTRRKLTLSGHPVEAYLEHARGRRAVLFAPRIAIATEYRDAFRAAGVASELVHGETPADERRRILDGVRDGSVTALCNVFVATEGFDAPGVDCVVLARGCGTAGVYLQMIGRALRPAPGKVDALVLDLCGASHVHGLPADDREYDLDGDGIRARSTERYCPICGAPLKGAAACPDCAVPAADLEVRYSGDALSRVAARVAATTPAQRAASYARWQAEGRQRGYRRGWAAMRYRGAFGEWPR